mgnify:CR=1 FL=1
MLYRWTTTQLGYSAEGCDFSIHEAYKLIWTPLQYSHKDIRDLVSNVFMGYDRMTEILQEINSANDTIENSVCKWLRKATGIWTSWLSSARAESKKKIFIGGMFPSKVEPEAVWSSPGDETGAHMAVERINADPKVLNDYELVLRVQPTQCRRELVIDAYITYLDQPDQNIIGVLGPACSKATTPLAEVSKFRNTILVGYAAGDISFSDRKRFPYYFRTLPTVSEFKTAYVHFFRYFGWKRCATLSESKSPPGTVSARAEYFTNQGIDIVSSRVLPSHKPLDAKGYIKSLKEGKVAIVILDAYPEFTRQIMCEAYKEVIAGFHLTSRRSCWCTVYKRSLIIFFV